MVPVAFGGDDDLDNLRAAHRWCNGALLVWGNDDSVREVVLFRYAARNPPTCAGTPRPTFSTFEVPIRGGQMVGRARARAGQLPSSSRARWAMQHHAVMNLGMTGEQWFTIIITLGSALVAAGATLAASLVTQGRTRQAELARHWADKRVEVHQRFMAAIENLASELVPGVGDNEETPEQAFDELYEAGRAVAIFGSTTTASAAKSVVDMTQRTRTMYLPVDDQEGRYAVVEAINDNYDVAVNNYLKAVRKEIGTEN